jgi:DNA sulfur modification protein DndD
MIIRKIKLTNFGIYSGAYTFDLLPLPTVQFNRPIILLRGKNGVGKSTLVTAIRLCLHGTLALDSRVAQQEFDDFLLRLIHRRPGSGNQPTETSVEVQFDYVNLGKKITYRVVRAWTRQANRVVKELSIWGNDKPVAESSMEHKEALLRELVPPGVLDLFFFDGEKIQTLAENSDHSNLLLAETVKNLLGLDTVEQLGKDLDLYIARQRSHSEVLHLQEELLTVMAELDALEPQLSNIHQQQQEVEAKITESQALIVAQERRISGQGGKFAVEREARLMQCQTLEVKIEALRRQASELCSGLLPFSITPKLLQAVAVRLEQEKKYVQEQIAHRALEQYITRLRTRLTSDEFWVAINEKLDAEVQQILLTQFMAALQTADSTTAPDEPPILELSEKEQGTLQSWIEQALDEVPQRFSKIISTLNEHEAQLAHIKADLARTPTVESIQPLLTQLHQYHHALGGLEREYKILCDEQQRLEYRKEQVTQQRQRIHEQIAKQQSETSRIYLATRTQQVLDAYKERVTARKISHLEMLLVNRFNQLCRKKGFLDRVQIDAQTFQVTLFRLGKEFSRQQLSAGENQLFAIATLWALREVSGRPLPVIVDTPLSRLDSEHRTSMIQEFFPFVSHQTLMLGTDLELDDDLYAYLQPAISHTYELTFDSMEGTTRVEHTAPQPNSYSVVLVE